MKEKSPIFDNVEKHENKQKLIAFSLSALFVCVAAGLITQFHNELYHFWSASAIWVREFWIGLPLFFKGFLGSLIILCLLFVWAWLVIKVIITAD